MLKNKTMLALLLLLCAALLLCACGKEEELPQIDPVMQYTEVPERFLALLITTDYQERYQKLVEATANAATKDDTLAAYAAYCGGFEELATDDLQAAMLAAHDPYAYDEKEFEQGRLLQATGFEFEEVGKGGSAVTYRFTVDVLVGSALGEQTGSLNGEITVRSTDAGERVAGYFFYEDGWLADLSEPIVEEEGKSDKNGK